MLILRKQNLLLGVVEFPNIILITVAPNGLVESSAVLIACLMVLTLLLPVLAYTWVDSEYFSITFMNYSYCNACITH
jgi:hypothetical protein